MGRKPDERKQKRAKRKGHLSLERFTPDSIERMPRTR